MSPLRRVTVAALLAVAVATVAGGALLWPGGRRAAGCAPAHAPVPAAARKALAAYAGRIEYTVERLGREREEIWHDPVTGRTRQVSIDSSGRVTNQFATSFEGRFELTTSVFYRTHSSIRSRMPAAVRPTQANAAADVAQSNRDDVADGKATILGRDTIDRRDTLHLRKTVNPPQPKLPAGAFPKDVGRHLLSFRVDTWVDPLTYLPLRIETTIRGHSSVMDDSWLPRTAAVLAKTRVAIPAGFKRAYPSQGGSDSFSVMLKATGCQS